MAGAGTARSPDRVGSPSCVSFCRLIAMKVLVRSYAPRNNEVSVCCDALEICINVYDLVPVNVHAHDVETTS